MRIVLIPSIEVHPRTNYSATHRPHTKRRGVRLQGRKERAKNEKKGRLQCISRIPHMVHEGDGGDAGNGEHPAAHRLGTWMATNIDSEGADDPKQHICPAGSHRRSKTTR